MLRRPRFTTNSLSFNGSSGYVDVGKMGFFPISMNTAYFTIMVWVKTTSTTPTVILGAVNISGVSNAIIFSVNQDQSYSTSSGKISLIVRDSGNNIDNIATTSATAVNDGNWHLIAITGYTPSHTYQYYFDGVAVPTSDGASTVIQLWTSFDVSMLLGAQNELGTPTNFFNGKIYQPRFYNCQFGSSEIFDAYKSRIYPHKLIYSEYLMTESSGTTIADNIAANTGTLHGGVTFSSDIP